MNETDELRALGPPVDYKEIHDNAGVYICSVPDREWRRIGRALDKYDIAMVNPFLNRSESGPMAQTETNGKDFRPLALIAARGIWGIRNALQECSKDDAIQCSDCTEALRRYKETLVRILEPDIAPVVAQEAMNILVSLLGMQETGRWFLRNRKKVSETRSNTTLLDERFGDLIVDAIAVFEFVETTIQKTRRSLKGNSEHQQSMKELGALSSFMEKYGGELHARMRVVNNLASPSVLMNSDIVKKSWINREVLLVLLRMNLPEELKKTVKLYMHALKIIVDSGNFTFDDQIHRERQRIIDEVVGEIELDTDEEQGELDTASENDEGPESGAKSHQRAIRKTGSGSDDEESGSGDDDSESDDDSDEIQHTGPKSGLGQRARKRPASDSESNDEIQDTGRKFGLGQRARKRPAGQRARKRPTSTTHWGGIRRSRPSGVRRLRHRRISPVSMVPDPAIPKGHEPESGSDDEDSDSGDDSKSDDTHRKRLGATGSDDDFDDNYGSGDDVTRHLNALFKLHSLTSARSNSGFGNDESKHKMETALATDVSVRTPTKVTEGSIQSKGSGERTDEDHENTGLVSIATKDNEQTATTIQSHIATEEAERERIATEEAERVAVEEAKAAEERAATTIQSRVRGNIGRRQLLATEATEAAKAAGRERVAAEAAKAAEERAATTIQSRVRGNTRRRQLLATERERVAAEKAEHLEIERIASQLKQQDSELKEEVRQMKQQSANESDEELLNIPDEEFNSAEEGSDSELDVFHDGDSVYDERGHRHTTRLCIESMHDEETCLILSQLASREIDPNDTFIYGEIVLNTRLDAADNVVKKGLDKLYSDTFFAFNPRYCVRDSPDNIDPDVKDQFFKDQATISFRGKKGATLPVRIVSAVELNYNRKSTKVAYRVTVNPFYDHKIHAQFRDVRMPFRDLKTGMFVTTDVPSNLLENVQILSPEEKLRKEIYTDKWGKATTHDIVNFSSRQVVSCSSERSNETVYAGERKLSRLIETADPNDNKWTMWHYEDTGIINMTQLVEPAISIKKADIRQGQGKVTRIFSGLSTRILEKMGIY